MTIPFSVRNRVIIPSTLLLKQSLCRLDFSIFFLPISTVGTACTKRQSFRSRYHSSFISHLRLGHKSGFCGIGLPRSIFMSDTVSTTVGNEKDSSAKDSIASNTNNKRPATDDEDQMGSNIQERVLSPSSAPPRPKKRSKEDAKKSRSWIRDFDDSRDTNKPCDKDLSPHAGSFANPALREEFGVGLVLDTNGDTDNNGDDSSKPLMTKKKVAMLVAFLGTKYAGFQVNPNQRTLQAEMELALYRTGMISASNFGFPHKCGWSSSARTDKGVHACAQVCSLKVEIPEGDLNNMEAVRQRLEANLPSDIRVLDMQRTTRNFCAKTQRDRVRYQYMIPSFLLHPDWVGLFTELGIDVETQRENAKDPLSVDEIERVQESLRKYRSTNESRQLLQCALKKYEGTHSFHNFTRGISAGQATAQRFIECFKLQDPVVMGDMEWIPTQILGQSFLLHQIRKMISMAIDVGRGAASIDIMDRALSKETTMNVHVAPAQGLFLEMSYFGGYNRRKGQSHNDLSDLDWTVAGPANDRWAAFRNVVRDHIVQEEKDHGNFIQYMYVQERIYDFRKMYNMEEGGGEDRKNGDKLIEDSDAKGDE